MKHIASWKTLKSQTLETCRIQTIKTGFLIESVINGIADDIPMYCAYKIRTDEQWQTVEFLVYTWLGWEEHTLQMHKNTFGIWERNGREANQFSDCIDIDISFTPFTNTLPIKRLSLEIGESKVIKVIYINIAKQTLEPLSQIYTKLSQNTYKYENTSNGFTTEISVDEDGLITNYPSIFQRL